jgi:hypothetical protein
MSGTAIAGPILHDEQSCDGIGAARIHRQAVQGIGR